MNEKTQAHAMIGIIQSMRNENNTWTKPLTETGKVILYLNDHSTTKWLSGNLDECEFSNEPHPSRTDSDSVTSELKNTFRHFLISFLYLQYPLPQAVTQTNPDEVAPQNSGVQVSALYSQYSCAVDSY